MLSATISTFCTRPNVVFEWRDSDNAKETETLPHSPWARRLNSLSLSLSQLVPLLAHAIPLPSLFYLVANSFAA